MSTVTIEEAQAKLPELIEHLAADEELVITRNARPVTKLSGAIQREAATTLWSWTRQGCHRVRR